MRQCLVAFVCAALLCACSAPAAPTAAPKPTIAVANPALTSLGAVMQPTAAPAKPAPPTPTLGVLTIGGAAPATAPAPAAEPTKPALAAPAAKPGRQRAEVVRVVDGDTIRLKVDGREENVRLIGINSPESVDPRRPVECLGKEASAKAVELLRGVPAVEVESDPTQDTRDRFGRLLLYLWLPDGRLFNREMIRLGYAHEYTYERAYRFQAEFRAAQREAEAAKVGLWATGACENQAPVSRSLPAPAAATPAPTNPTAAATQAGKPTAGVKPTGRDCPASHPIKGNQGSRSTDEWIYHLKGGASYGANVPEECFASEDAARAAGYRKALR